MTPLSIRKRRMQKKRKGTVTLGGIAAEVRKHSLKLDEIDARFDTLEEKLDKRFEHIDKMFEIIVENMATKDDIFVLQTQINGIESQLKGMQYEKLKVRVSDLEESVFGEDRS